MPLIPYLNKPFRTDHENHIFQYLIIELGKITPENETWALIGNFNVGTENDALLIKNDAFVLIELKNYDGIIENVCENGTWKIITKKETKTITSGASENPFLQIKQNGIQFYSNKLKGKENYPISYYLIFFHGLGDFGYKSFDLPFHFKTNDTRRGNNQEGLFHVCGRKDLLQKIKEHFISDSNRRITNEQISDFVSNLNCAPYKEFLFDQILKFTNYFGDNDGKAELISGERNGPIRKDDKVYISVYHYLQFKKRQPQDFDTQKIGAYFSSLAKGDDWPVTYKLVKTNKIITSKRFEYNLLEINDRVFFDNKKVIEGL